MSLFFTIPYTGTWGVVIGKATGAGACTEKNTKTKCSLNFDLKVDCKHNPSTVSLISNLSIDEVEYLHLFACSNH